jgi:rhodanese-related sulfurtransferase
MRPLPQPGRRISRLKNMDKFLQFAGNNTLLVLGLMISFFVLVFTELRRKAAGLIAVDPTAAVSLINNDAVVIDLRTAESFSRGHIVNAKNIPFDEFAGQRDKVDKFKSTPVIAVCDSGATSNKAVDSLRKSGFESVYGLKGGMAAWTQAGLPVVTGKKTKSKRKK